MKKNTTFAKIFNEYDTINDRIRKSNRTIRREENSRRNKIAEQQMKHYKQVGK